ncbi:NTP transferase domain-containing protein [Vulcanisaeta souniana]|uniref:NTP transferase domain-containing protein n=1 Tax=Vulcanisaeta souniana TaxID=164452 RepID=UPI000B336EE3|nr:NTP transferase domain-containing protein [Vulcanisaeta souniana]
MNIIIMAGGMGGSRLSNPNKPLIDICGKPIIEHVASSINGFGRVYVATTIRHGEVVNWARQHGYEIAITSGRGGYPEDLLESLSMVSTPVIFVPADMPS